MSLYKPFQFISRSKTINWVDALNIKWVEVLEIVEIVHMSKGKNINFNPEASRLKMKNFLKI